MHDNDPACRRMKKKRVRHDIIAVLKKQSQTNCQHGVTLTIILEATNHLGP